ncbi:MAG TPA: hypothetical protein DC057_03235 [Spirochaetia bacterium]|nr:hypothetical protein [Spirochaetia bacterium]
MILLELYNWSNWNRIVEALRLQPEDVLQSTMSWAEVRCDKALFDRWYKKLSNKLIVLKITEPAGCRGLNQ